MFSDVTMDNNVAGSIPIDRGDHEMPLPSNSELQDLLNALPNDYSAVQNDSSAVQNDSSAVSNDSSAVQNDSSALQNDPSPQFQPIKGGKH